MRKRQINRSLVTVYKHDHTGREVWHYVGEVLARGATWLQLEARFDRPDHALEFVVFQHGDRFIEWFYTDRGYNIFEVHAVDDDHLKGWYCNVTRPALISADAIHSDDLALDLWITPRGEAYLLDEDEFTALDLDAPTRAQALDALHELRTLVANCTPPFDAVP